MRLVCFDLPGWFNVCLLITGLVLVLGVWFLGWGLWLVVRLDWSFVMRCWMVWLLNSAVLACACFVVSGFRVT